MVGLTEIFNRGFTNINKTIKKINKNLEEDLPLEETDIQLLIKLLKDFKKKFDKINNERKIKKYIIYFGKALYPVRDWQSYEDLKYVSVHSNNVLEIFMDIERGEFEDVVEFYQGIDRFKTTFSTFVANLIKSLTAKLAEIK